MKLVRMGVVGLFTWCTRVSSGADNWVRFSEDGRQIVVDTEGIVSFHAASSAVYEMDEKTHRVGTKDDVLIEPVRETTGTTSFGNAVISTATYAAEGSPYHYTLKLKRLEDLRAFTLQAMFHNHSARDVKLKLFHLLDTDRNTGGSFAVANAADWLVTPLMENSTAQPLSEMNKRLNEAAMVYRADGVGFLVGPVGPAEAFTIVEVRDQMIKADVEMDNVLVRAGESRSGEEMIFCFEPPVASVDAWTRWVAITHGARLSKSRVYGWCSWYDRTTKIDEAHTLEVAKTLAENPNVFGKGILQIDDGYQKMDGDWSANARFPSGMAGVAAKIREIGWIPGVWFAPLMINPAHPWAKANLGAIQKNAEGIASFMNPNAFHPDGAQWIVPDHPESKKFLFNIIKDARDRGYGYIKIDFNGIGSRFVDPTKTRLQIFRELYALYREAAGEEMYILSCLGQPTRGVVGFVDAARVGPDSHPRHFEQCLKSVLRFQVFDNIWWQNDPDVSYLATDLPSRMLGPTTQGEGMWRSWHAINALVGGTAMISEPINEEDVRNVWRNYEIMRPSSIEPARLLSLGLSAHNTVFGFSAKRTYGDFAVYNFYNDREGAKSLTLDFAPAGLPKGIPCAVFDYWANRVIGYAQDSYATEPVAYLSSLLLRFTPIDGDGPILVGSDLHLSIGATEINHVRVSSAGVEVELNDDAGAQAGCLTFYSTRALKAETSENCDVTSVENLGDNLWKVKITGRQMGKAQRCTLAFQDKG